MHGLQALSPTRIHVLHGIQETSFLNVELCEEPRSNSPKQQPTAHKQQLVELVSEPKIAHAKLSVTGAHRTRNLTEGTEDEYIKNSLARFQQARQTRKIQRGGGAEG